MLKKPKKMCNSYLKNLIRKPPRIQRSTKEHIQIINLNFDLTIPPEINVLGIKTGKSLKIDKIW